MLASEDVIVATRWVDGGHCTPFRIHAAVRCSFTRCGLRLTDARTCSTRGVCFGTTLLCSHLLNGVVLL